ncbi:MAG: [Fe-Fe] hydrogenase large subunit C-terminal domain-containing protein [Ignavibacteria bacterium]
MNNNTQYHAIYFESSKCTGDMACMKACPVEAIRVRNRKSFLLENKCIDCGECVKVCKSEAIVPLTNSFTDFSKFEYTVAIPSLALYSQFDIDIKPETILTSLKTLGFDEVIDITHACVSVYKAIGNYLDEYKGKRPLINTFCPTSINLIQTCYPEMLDRIIPVIPPMEVAAKVIRKETAERLGIEPEEIGVIYITPCPSKMVMISQKVGKFYSDFDGAISISDIYKPLFTSIRQNIKRKGYHPDYYDISGFGLNLGIMGGLTSTIGNNRSITVSGINNVIRMLDEMEQGKLFNIDLVDLNACSEGCLGGTLVVDNVYIARSKMLHLINSYGEKKLAVRKKDKYEGSKILYEDLYESTEISEPRGTIAQEIEKITKRKEISVKLPNINCGACGSPTCMTFAEDVVKSEAKMNDCVFIFNEELKHKLKEKIMDVLELQSKLDDK